MPSSELKVDDDGDLWLRAGEDLVFLGPVEGASWLVPDGLEAEYEAALDEWRDRFDAEGEAEWAWLRGKGAL